MSSRADVTPIREITTFISAEEIPIMNGSGLEKKRKAFEVSGCANCENEKKKIFFVVYLIVGSSGGEVRRILTKVIDANSFLSMGI